MTSLKSLRAALALALLFMAAAVPLSRAQSSATAEELQWGTTPQSGTDAVLLVAKPGLDDSTLASTVLLVKPLDSGGHAGFIVNKPTQMTMGEAFPDDEPSQKVQDPVFLGGPVGTNIIFALVRRADSPGPDAVRFTKDLFMAMATDTVDRIIQNEADHARFFAGAMVWQPGELKQQVEEGAWYVRDVDPEVPLSRDVDGMWEDMVREAEQRARLL